MRWDVCIEISQQAPEALSAWFGHDEPVIVTAFEHDVVRGFLPLKRVRDRVFGIETTRLEPLSPYHAHADAEAARAMLEQLAEQVPFSLLELGGEGFATAAARLHGMRFGAQCVPGQARAAVALGSDIDSWFHALDGWAAPLARRARSLMAAGELELVTAEDPRAGRELFGLYVELEARSPKLDAANGVSGDPRRAARCAALAENGQLLFHLLLLDGLPIAGSISTRFGDRLVQLEGVCDMGFEDVAPDEVLFMLQVRDAICRSASALELCPDLVPRATRLGATVTETQRVQLYRRFGLHHLDGLWNGLSGIEVATALPGGPMRSDLGRQLRARTHAAEALDRLEGSGVELSRLWGDPLRAALPFPVEPAEHERVRRAV